MVSSDFRKEAREKLSGKWGKAACITLAYCLITIILNFINNNTTGIINSIISICTCIIEIPLSFGFIMSFVKLFNEQDVGAFDFLKSGYDNFKRSWSIAWYTFVKMIWPFLLMVLAIIILIIGLGSTFFAALKGNVDFTGLGAMSIISCILIIVASIWGTMLSYYYKIAPIIAADNENMTGKEAVEESRKRMEGKRGKLFCLELSFIGWAILGILSFGIGFIWLTPYIQTALVSFYKSTNSNEVTEPVQSKEQIEE